MFRPKNYPSQTNLPRQCPACPVHFPCLARCLFFVKEACFYHRNINISFSVTNYFLLKLHFSWNFQRKKFPRHFGVSLIPDNRYNNFMEPCTWPWWPARAEWSEAEWSPCSRPSLGLGGWGGGVRVLNKGWKVREGSEKWLLGRRWGRRPRGGDWWTALRKVGREILGKKAAQKNIRRCITDNNFGTIWTVISVSKNANAYKPTIS